MAISKRFGGVEIFIPGAYDTKNVILTGAAPSVAVGKVAIIGESTKGDSGRILQFSPEALSDLLSEYGEGPIADAARVLVNPSNDARIAQGASAIYVLKTNGSTKASTALGAYGTAKAIEFGAGGNQISVEFIKNDALADEVAGGEFDETSILSGDTFSIIELGTAINTFTFATDVVDNADLAAQLADAGNWSLGLPTDTVLVVSGTNGASVVTVSLVDDANDHLLGAKRQTEILSELAQGKMALPTGMVGNTVEPTLRSIVTKTSEGIVEDTADENLELGGRAYLDIGYVLGTTATLTITATQLITAVTGGTGTDLTLTLSDFATLDALAEYINTQPGYECSVSAGANGGLSPSVLDRVAAVGILCQETGACAQIKGDSYDVFRHFDATSVLVDLERASFIGLPVQAKTFLTGAVKGSSATSDFIAALTALEGIEDVDIVIPLVSQDASDDLVEDPTITDSASSYDVESIHIATRNHCKLMSSVRNRKERTCYLGFRGTFDECVQQSLALASEFCSLLIQDVSVAGADGNLVFKQPHVAAAMCAGMQAGGDIGEPTTAKIVAAGAIRHRKKQGLEPDLIEEFDPNKKGRQAIQNNLFVMKQRTAGGIKIMAQNTTYSRDNNFVFNRPSVIEAMNFIAKTIRAAMEDRYIGTKSRTATRDNIEAEMVGLMADFLRSDIIVGDDTNGGLGYKDLAVRIEGNTVFIDITVTVVQGIDFIFTNIAIDDIRVAA